MAINRPIIAAGATVSRSATFSQPVQVASVAPGETYRTTDSTGAVLDITVSANFEGQLYFQRVGSEVPYFYAMYVVVDIEGTLTWVPVDLTSKTNQYTGRPFDPMG